MQWRPVTSDVSTSCQHSSKVTAAGTSTAACLPFVHGLHANRRVQLPGRGIEDDVDIVPVAQALIIGRTSEYPSGAGPARLLNHVLGPLHFTFDDVADRLDFDVLESSGTRERGCVPGCPPPINAILTFLAGAGLPRRARVHSRIRANPAALFQTNSLRFHMYCALLVSPIVPPGSAAVPIRT